MAKNHDDGYAPLNDKALLRLSRSGWAWEFLRSNVAYQKEAKAAKVRRQIIRAHPLLEVIETAEVDEAGKWGLCIVERADRSFGHASVFWRPDIDPGILPIAAAPTHETPGDDDAVDFCHSPFAVTVFKAASGREHVLLCDGAHAIQFHVHSGTVLKGPVRLAFQPDRLALKKEEVLTLGQFVALRRDGRFDESLFPLHPNAERWSLALKVLTLAPPGARPNYLRLGAALFSSEDITHWTMKNDWIRSRLRRAFREGRYLANGGYLKILSTDNADFIPPRLML